MKDNAAILTEMVDTIKNDVINSIQAKGKYATGSTVKALEISASPNNVQLLAPEYIDALEKGRKPTGPDAAKGDPTVFERIKEWCAAKGIDEKFAYAITKNIHEKGYPGTPGVLTEPLSDDNINKRMDTFLDQLANNEADNILQLFA